MLLLKSKDDIAASSVYDHWTQHDFDQHIAKVASTDGKQQPQVDQQASRCQPVAFVTVSSKLRMRTGCHVPSVQAFGGANYVLIKLLRSAADLAPSQRAAEAAKSESKLPPPFVLSFIALRGVDFDYQLQVPEIAVAVSNPTSYLPSMRGIEQLLQFETDRTIRDIQAVLMESKTSASSDAKGGDHSPSNPSRSHLLLLRVSTCSFIASVFLLLSCTLFL